MKFYFPIPFPFSKIINGEKRVKNQSLEDNIRSNIRFLIFTRLGDFAYDRSMGFDIWDFDKVVFFPREGIYYDQEVKQQYRGMMEDAGANQFFMNNLKRLIENNEPRVDKVETKFEIKSISNRKAEYQRQISIKVTCEVENIEQFLHPPIEIKMFYSPFKVEMT